MSTAAVYNMEGAQVGELELKDSIFACPVNESVMHQALVLYLASQRRGTHATKTRGMISGGGKKPFRQKGTGHARQGSSRSPIMEGGGTIFGPQPRSYSFKMPKKMRRLALLSALSDKAQNGNLIIFDELKFEAPKTQAMAAALDKVSANNALLVVEVDNKNAALSARNLPKVTPVNVSGINVYELLKHDKLVMTKEAVGLLQEVYG